MGILQDVHCREDLLKLSEPQKACLCREIREFLIESVSKTGGHLAGISSSMKSEAKRS
mgnify:CR=1 FL=1